MTNESRTRRLIVTLPDVTGEEADVVATNIESDITDDDRFYPVQRDATVEHVIGDVLPDNVSVRSHYADFVHVNLFVDSGLPIARQLSLYEARQLAGALLAIPNVANAEPPTNCAHCGAAGHHANNNDQEV